MGIQFLKIQSETNDHLYYNYNCLHDSSHGLMIMTLVLYSVGPGSNLGRRFWKIFADFRICPNFKGFLPLSAKNGKDKTHLPLKMMLERTYRYKASPHPTPPSIKKIYLKINDLFPSLFLAFFIFQNTERLI